MMQQYDIIKGKIDVVRVLEPDTVTISYRTIRYVGGVTRVVVFVFCYIMH